MTREGLRDGPTADCKSAARAQTEFDSQPSHHAHHACLHYWWEGVIGIALWGLAIGLAIALAFAPVACVARLMMRCQ